MNNTKARPAPPHSKMLSALRLAGEGKPVFPLKPLGKTPLTEHGFKDATTDQEQIQAWWKEWPDANIPSLLVAVQSPFTMQNGELFEGSPDEVGDLAGFMVQLTYDNPVIPNLTLELGRRQKVFGQRVATDSKFDKTTFAVSSSFFF